MSRGKGISLFLCSLTSISILFLSYTEAFLPSPSVEHRWMNQSRLYARRRRRNPSRFNEDHEGNDPMNNNIPQLPPSTGRPTTILQKSGTGKEDDPPLVTRKFQLSYTCKVCDTKNSHMVSRVAYNNGVVVVTCKGCGSQHMIADNLGWSNHPGGFEGAENIEKFLDERGKGHTINRVDRNVWDLEQLLEKTICDEKSDTETDDLSDIFE